MQGWLDLQRILDNTRAYLFYYPDGMVNNPAQFALLLALLLVIFYDIRKNIVILGIFGGIMLIFLSTKEAPLLSMPLLAAYTTYRVSERFEGVRSYAVIAAGFILFILACSFDGLFGMMY